MPKTAFYKSSDGKNTLLGETPDSALATRIENAVKSFLSPKPKGHLRPVKVVKVDDEHFAKFVKSGKRPRVEQVFESAVAAAGFVGAHFNALTSAFSAAKRNGAKPLRATIRGITFSYVD